ncbi:hypothetical protein TNIN_15391 [Trichonephila inaurata madagascariensis]|uniref:Uncharacterized protein n=1 Tax=Trichonephila inaurata madagascariensis TaxID=2747483 RepID=A0A8X6JSC0_9ARAC|nr:hypothetical protein TNIN_15391 [Trichonephila inaurata madagascariensis]
MLCYPIGGKKKRWKTHLDHISKDFIFGIKVQDKCFLTTASAKSSKAWFSVGNLPRGALMVSMSSKTLPPSEERKEHKHQKSFVTQ